MEFIVPINYILTTFESCSLRKYLFKESNRILLEEAISEICKIRLLFSEAYKGL